jgi:DNA-binding response OmpR family regulator
MAVLRVLEINAMTAVTATSVAGLSFADADALLFDPVAANRVATRTALSAIGFRRVTATAMIDDLPKLLSGRVFDLFVADITQDAEKACDLVRSIRDSQTGENPFLHIVLMAWKLEGDLVKRALNCGADDLITRPFSVDFLAARIRTHTEARKPFIVTSDYIGPDRRRAPPRNSADLFQVPNRLLAKASVSPRTAAADEIKLANARVNAERARKCAFKIAFTLQCLRDTDTANVMGDLGQLEAVARDLLTRAQGSERNAVHAAVTGLLDALAPIQAGDVSVTHLDKMDQSARTLLGLLYPGRSKDEILREVSAAVVTVKARERNRQKIA